MKVQLRKTAHIFSFSLAFCLLSLSSSAIAASPDILSSKNEPTASLSENRLGGGFNPSDEPVCPAEYGSGRAGELVSSQKCLKLDPRHVNPDGTLRTRDFRDGSRANSWMVFHKHEWVDFWAEAYIFTGERHGGADSRYYKLCGCYRDYRRSGCFSPETKITMADGSEKEVREISAGEYVKSAYDGEPLKIVQIIEGPEADKLVELHVGQRTLRVSKEHPVLVYSPGSDVSNVAMRTTTEGKRKLLRADQLQPGMHVQLADGNFAPITSITRPDTVDGQYVVNFVLGRNAGSDNAHLLLSEGIVTGDIVLQRRLLRRQLQAELAQQRAQ